MVIHINFLGKRLMFFTLIWNERIDTQVENCVGSKELLWHAIIGQSSVVYDEVEVTHFSMGMGWN